jgi:N-acetylglucosamine kinase-like BadF-type ATPase
MQSMEVILAIDGGGSRTRCLAVDRGGRLVGRSLSGPSNHLLVSKDEVVRALADATNRALARAALSRADVRCVSAGLAGVDYDGRGADEMEEVFRELSLPLSVVNGDMVIAHAGALEGNPGVVALAGTGSVIFGVGVNKERVKVGGWGPVYGDEGSAYRMGQRALVAAARAYDGRGPATALGAAILRALGLQDFRGTVERVYVSGMEAREIAALSRVAYEVAERGDEAARAIFVGAGEELAEGVQAAVNRLDLGAAATVSYQGGVLSSCAIVRESFIARLMKENPHVSVLPPKFEPVVGAYLLGCEALGWEPDGGAMGQLAAQVSVEAEG